MTDNTLIVGDLSAEKGIGPDVSALIEKARAFTVKTAEDEMAAIEQAKGLKDALKDLEAQEDKLIGPAKAWTKQVQAWARPLKDQVNTGIDALKMSVLIWRQNVAKAQAEAAEKARKEREKKEAAAAKAGKPAPFIPPTPVIAPANTTRADGASGTVRKIRKFRIIDAAAIPREYMIPDEKKIGGLVRAGLESIPGVEIYEEDSLAIR